MDPSQFGFINNLRLKLKGGGLAAVLIIIALCITAVSIWGTGETKGVVSALSVLGLAAVLFWPVQPK